RSQLPGERGEHPPHLPPLDLAPQQLAQPATVEDAAYLLRLSLLEDSRAESERTGVDHQRRPNARVGACGAEGEVTARAEADEDEVRAEATRLEGLHHALHLWLR